jgi:hypothetical protein
LISFFAISLNKTNFQQQQTFSLTCAYGIVISYVLERRKINAARNVSALFRTNGQCPYANDGRDREEPFADNGWNS